MNMNDLLELVRAGFTKEEIMNLNVGVDTTSKTDNTVVNEEPVVKEEPQTIVPPVAPAPTPVSPTPAPITLSAEDLQKLIQGVAVRTTSGTIDMPKTVDQTLADRLMSLYDHSND